jgi:hypothetical protein
MTLQPVTRWEAHLPDCWQQSPDSCLTLRARKTPRGPAAAAAAGLEEDAGLRRRRRRQRERRAFLKGLQQ